MAGILKKPAFSELKEDAEMSKISDTRPIMIDPSTNCLFTTDASTGDPVWIIDATTGLPMTNRPFYVDPNTGCYYVVDTETMLSAWVIDPATGEPMRGAIPPQQEEAEQAQSESETAIAQGIQQPATNPAAGTSIENQAEPLVEQATSQQSHAMSGMAVAGLVLGIIALLTSFLPIINNGSFLLAILGIIFAIVGIIKTGKGKLRGRGIATASLIICALSIVVTLVTQSLYVTAIDSAVDQLQHGSQPVSSSSGDSPQSESEPDGIEHSVDANNTNADEDYSKMPIGESVTFESGLTITVTAAEGGLTSAYDDDVFTGITVHYINNGSSNASFNPFDWKAKDIDGVLRSATYYMQAENMLDSGQLTPGGEVTGNVYFEGEVTEVYYYENSFLQSDSNVGWML